MQRSFERSFYDTFLSLRPFTQGCRMDSKTRLSLSFLILVTILVNCLHAAAPRIGHAEEARPLRILYVMSYHSPWRWTDGQLQGFKEGFGDTPAEFRSVELDTKRNSNPETIAARAEQAVGVIDAWQPDLIYTSDDDAQKYVASRYVNATTPIVFSGVNNPPEQYGFRDSENVTGVLEHEHFVESVRLLQAIVPGVRKLAVVFDDAPLWKDVQQRMLAKARELPGIEFVFWDTIRTYDEYKQRIAFYQSRADAIALIGIFNFKDKDGRNVPYQDVLRWTAENSLLPDFSFWVDRVHYGTLASVTVSEHEQGFAAGRMARAILVDGQRPSSIPMTPTTKGLPVISLARARLLGIGIKSGLLLSSQVIPEFEWDKTQ